ncbi:MAG: glutamine-hydrolyzing GMP synthase [Spirochaetales bacterium]|nr:glutamine-hydrolyzing GMP synthase [Spirochaetales bacterium]
MDKILILDFGSQTTQLIARRIREIGVYSEIIPGDSPFDPEILHGVRGLIFSGSPYSVYEDGAPLLDKNFYETGLPVLGICYGFQRMTEDHSGKVASLEKKEYGRSPIHVLSKNPLFHDIPEGFISWMSHGDSINTLGEGFESIAESKDHPAMAFNSLKNLYGIQFHPEVSHCEYGIEILENFVCGIAGVSKGWNMDSYLTEVSGEIKQKVGNDKVLLLISGGVDSTVAGGLLLKALDPDQVHLMYIDTGLMRKNESAEVEVILSSLGAKHLHMIDASERFLSSLEGVADPEKKRQIIGDLFITVQETEVARIGIDEAYLAQGTLYTDMIESGKGVGEKAHVIKSHHNVRSPLVEAKRKAGSIIEPLARLYKDEVRALGLRLGLSEEIVHRHPFPGPGLAVRILGEITREKCTILKEADYLFIRELKKRNLYNKIWQAFCILLPVRSVGVAGDAREYGYVLALRAITSRDGMTADVFAFDSVDLLEISSIITNSVKEIGRVVYDISSKPPATIEWE